MADFLIQATLSNLLVSTILATIAWLVQRRVRSASLANLLWAIVLVKMVTPPLVSLPVIQVPMIQAPMIQAPMIQAPIVFSSSTLPAGHSNETLDNDAPESARRPSESGWSSRTGSSTDSRGSWSRRSGLVIFVWIAVSVALFVTSSIRIMRFHWLLKSNSRLHSELTAGVSRAVARQLDLRRSPEIYVSSANIPPFVWWMGGRSIVVISALAIRELSDNDLRCVITHELAHIKRRDHWFRWLEWFTLIGLWWNPVMWWARVQLRLSEEIACDDLVLETARLDVHQYATSLLNMAELLASPAIRPPVVASAINSGGNLEERLKKMIADKTWKAPSALRLGIVALACCVFPLGIVCAQDLKSVERRLGGAVEAGELTLEQARLMMDALKRSAGSKHADAGDIEARKRRYMAFANSVKAAVEAGKVSKDEAEKKLLAVRREMFADTNQKKESQVRKNAELELAAKERRLVDFYKEIEAAVKAGKLTKEVAQKKLNEMRRKMSGSAGKKDLSRGASQGGELEADKRRFMETIKAIDAALGAGKISKEEAQEKLNALRKETPPGAVHKEKKPGSSKENDLQLEARKRRQMQFYKEIEAAVKAGKLSKEDAQKKLNAIRKETPPGAVRKEKKPGSSKENDLQLGARKRRQMAYYKELEAAVKAGKLSKEEAQKKLNAIRKETPPGAVRKEKKPESSKENDLQLEARKRRQMQFYKELEAAVKAGKLSKEEAQKKLNALRKETPPGAVRKEKKPGSSKEYNLQLEARKRRQMAYYKELEAAVKAGKLSKEEAQKKLNAIRKETSAGDATKGETQRNNNKIQQLEAKKRYYMAFAKEIESAIKAGKLSKEDAEKKLIELRTKLFRADD